MSVDICIKIVNFFGIKPDSRLFLALVSAYHRLTRHGSGAHVKNYYSQFGEDVILQNLVGNFFGQYLDIGSGHPVRGSNTYWLYRRGWSGITIDPFSANVEFARKLRPRDTSLKAVVGSTNQEKQFYEYEIYELSTTETDRVNDLRAQGIYPIRTYLMKSITLRSLRVFATPLDLYVLSIDVEGAEIEVLRGNDWAEFTPPIIVIEEHTPPWSKVSEISEFLNLRGYELSDYVGLSSIYIHVDSRFRIQRSNQVIKGNSNNLHLD